MMRLLLVDDSSGEEERAATQGRGQGGSSTAVVNGAFGGEHRDNKGGVGAEEGVEEGQRRAAEWAAGSLAAIGGGIQVDAEMVSVMVSLAVGCDDEDACAEVDGFLSAWMGQVCQVSRESRVGLAGTVRGASIPRLRYPACPCPDLEIVVGAAPPALVAWHPSAYAWRGCCREGLQRPPDP